MSITLPPLPHPVMNAMLGDDWADLFTADQLRARDIEVARLVLEGAADLVDSNAACCSGQTAAILGANADAIRALEVRHAE